MHPTVPCRTRGAQGPAPASPGGKARLPAHTTLTPNNNRGKITKKIEPVWAGSERKEPQLHI